ncbi:MAG: DUF6515 family protein [Deltaproteobacteria bacterium]
MKIEFLKKAALVIGAAVIALQPCVSYARDSQYDRHTRYYRYHDRPRYGARIEFISNEYRPVTARGMRYYYYDGLYYAPGTQGYVLVEPPEGAVVPAIPFEYRPVIINGVTYYTDNSIYYVYTPYGYKVVRPMRVVQPPVAVAQQPAVVTQPAVVRTETVSVAAPNRTKVAEGMGLGAILGALTGGIIGHQMKGRHEAGGALIGGAAGAAVGGIVGAQMPNEAK